MPGRSRKYNREKDAELKMHVIDVLNEAGDNVNPTLDWIKERDPMILGPHSTQKLARILSSLNDMGLVKKSKSKATGRMVYRLTSKMTETGYQV